MRSQLNEWWKGVRKEAARALAAGAWFLLAGAGQALAALPQAVNPSTGDPGGNWLELIKGYFKDGGIVLGLALSVAAFLWFAWIIIAKFNDARKDRGAEWGEVALVGIVGGAVLLVITFLLAQAAGVID